MTTLYVLRGYHWGYNDETYYPAGSYIHSTFDNEGDACNKKQSLELEFWKEMNFSETNVFFDGDAELCKKINTFTFDKCGEKMFDEEAEFSSENFLPDKLSDDDAMTVLKMAGLESYKLVSFDTTPVFYAIWFPKDDSYLKIHEECTTALIYSDSRAELEAETDGYIEFQWDDNPIIYKGSYSDFSDNPTALESIVKATEGLNYIDGSKQLQIKTDQTKALFAVNDLLKEPLFEIKSLTLDDIKKIEINLRAEYEEEY